MFNYSQLNPPVASEVAMTLIYKTLWDHSSKKSLISGLWLREYAMTPLFNNCFLHVLPVKKYPYFRHYFKNLALVTPGERGLWMEGKEEERIQYALDFEDKTQGRCTANWDLIKKLEAELLVEYKKVFPSTVGGLLNYHYSLHKQQVIIGTLNKKFLDSL